MTMVEGGALWALTENTGVIKTRRIVLLAKKRTTIIKRSTFLLSLILSPVDFHHESRDGRGFLCGWVQHRKGGGKKNSGAHFADTLYLFKFELELMAETARYAFNVCMNLKNVLLRLVLLVKWKGDNFRYFCVHLVGLGWSWFPGWHLYSHHVLSY